MKWTSSFALYTALSLTLVLTTSSAAKAAKAAPSTKPAAKSAPAAKVAPAPEAKAVEAQGTKAEPAPGDAAAATVAQPLGVSESVAPVSDFSWGRFVLESLVSGVVGSAAALGTYYGICGGELCLGGALAGLGVNVVVTPLAAYLLGTVSGGNGTLSKAYYGGIMGLGIGCTALAAHSGAALGLGLALMPFTSALGYELSATVEPTSCPAIQQVSFLPTFNPVTGGGDPTGAVAMLMGTF